ncbi:LuxR C-terminal-related transcriptional regulator [Chryseobacterium sp. JUb7]|uniref:helix-turn-helix transcriptional regulator n=1 Tax=Chryseobacterium sp. JUb7 TaxID=2940599 RepID=UPI00216832D2|nr:LuxR C-terminal-related transcriptional regulator [Chryseobacterium sp. JUb7]MCS3531698.1 DNA-binding CsgD family transcriptional regulator [Chryseobacterium sp. JUb7]
MNEIINSLWKDSHSKGKNVSKQYLEVLKVLARSSFGCIYIVDLKKEKIEFISQNPYLFSGLKSVEVEKLGYNFYRQYTKTEDLEILRKVNTSGFKFFECLPAEEKTSHTITYDFHIKNTNNIDVLINHKLTPIELCEEGNISKIVCVVSYSLKRTAGNIRIVSETSDVLWHYNLSTGKWQEEFKVSLKPREREIIRLYLRGLTIEEIAEELFVSASTVKFHRSKLFEKIGVNNITEAISYVVENKLI